MKKADDSIVYDLMQERATLVGLLRDEVRLTQALKAEVKELQQENKALRARMKGAW